MLTETNNFMLSKGQEVEFFIEKLLYGGGGLAHFGSMACFVDDVIPGETGVRISILLKNSMLLPRYLQSANLLLTA